MRRTAAVTVLLLLAACDQEPPPPAARLCADAAVAFLRYRGEPEIRGVTQVDGQCLAVEFAAMTRFNAPGGGRAVCCFAGTGSEAPLTSLEIEGRQITGPDLDRLLDSGG